MWVFEGRNPSTGPRPATEVTQWPLLGGYYTHINHTPKPRCARCIGFEGTTKMRTHNRGTCLNERRTAQSWVFSGIIHCAHRPGSVRQLLQQIETNILCNGGRAPGTKLDNLLYKSDNIAPQNKIQDCTPCMKSDSRIWVESTANKVNFSNSKGRRKLNNVGLGITRKDHLYCVPPTNIKLRTFAEGAEENT